MSKEKKKIKTILKNYLETDKNKKFWFLVNDILIVF